MAKHSLTHVCVESVDMPIYLHFMHALIGCDTTGKVSTKLAALKAIHKLKIFADCKF